MKGIAENAIIHIMIRQIKLIGIPVADQQRALDFYTSKLDFYIITDQPMGAGQRWIELGIKGAQTGIVLFTPEGHEDRIGTFLNSSWAVGNIDETYKQLLERGVEREGPPEKQPWGSFIKIKDSEGNTILLSQAR